MEMGPKVSQKLNRRPIENAKVAALAKLRLEENALEGSQSGINVPVESWRLPLDRILR